MTWVKWGKLNHGSTCTTSMVQLTPKENFSWVLIYVRALTSSCTNTRWWTLVDLRLEEI